MPSRSDSWVINAGLIVVAITALRIVLLAYSQADAFVDEAQYWLWGQTLDFGYYSKPPIAAWVIRLTTDLAGSDTAFWIRLPGPVFHGATALILGVWAARLFDGPAGWWVAVSYATLPIVGLGSIVMSTDTIMAPFFAAALLFHSRLLETRSGRDAALAGLMIGLAFMSKYAAVYFFMGAGLAAIFVPAYRISIRNLAVLLAVFAVVISPNIYWNLANDLATIEHTLDNVDWVRDASPEQRLHFDALLEFFGSQFAVMGPILFAALLWMVTRKKDSRVAGLLWLSLPVVVLVCVQALLSRAYGNWAFAAYLAGTVAVVPWLLANARRFLVASLVFNTVLVLALPVATVFAQSLTFGRPAPVLIRALGRDEMSRQILDLATNNGAQAVVAVNRDVLADLFLTGQDSGITVYALAARGRAKNYYQQKFPYMPDVATSPLFVTRAATVACDGAAIVPLQTLDTSGGAYQRWTYRAYRLPPGCLPQITY